jgi:hypothetical protein
MEKRMKESYAERLSESRRPRAMRRRSVRARRSVGQGCMQASYRASKIVSWGADAIVNAGRQHCQWRYARATDGPHGVVEPVHVCDLSMFENREVPRSPACGDGRAGRRSRRCRSRCARVIRGSRWKARTSNASANFGGDPETPRFPGLRVRKLARKRSPPAATGPAACRGSAQRSALPPQARRSTVR